MAEEIVSCPGCGKKFRIPDGAPPGSFACTACGADVAYGPAAAAPAKRASSGGRSSARRSSGGRSSGKRSSDRRAAGGRTAGGRSSGGESSGRRRSSSRRRRGDDGDRPGSRARRTSEKEKNTLPLVIGLMGVVLLLGVGILVFGGGKKDPEPDPVPVAGDSGGDDSSGGGGLDATDLAGGGGGATDDGGGDDAGGSTAAGTGTAGTTGTAGSDTGSGTGSGTGTGTAGTGTGTTAATPPASSGGEASGIGRADGGETDPGDGGYRYWFVMYQKDPDRFFEDTPPLEGTTDAEIAEFEKNVEMFADIDSGRPGIVAGDWLVEQGKKSIPFMLNKLGDQYRGGKWEGQDEQWASWQIQQYCKRIIQATKMPSTLEARFNPGGENDPKTFARAAAMWIAWWRGTGKHLEAFTPHPEETE